MSCRHTLYLTSSTRVNLHAQVLYLCPMGLRPTVVQLRRRPLGIMAHHTLQNHVIRAGCPSHVVRHYLSMALSVSARYPMAVLRESAKYRCVMCGPDSGQMLGLRNTPSIRGVCEPANSPMHTRPPITFSIPASVSCVG